MLADYFHFIQCAHFFNYLHISLDISIFNRIMSNVQRPMLLVEHGMLGKTVDLYSNSFLSSYSLSYSAGRSLGAYCPLLLPITLLLDLPHLSGFLFALVLVFPLPFLLLDAFIVLLLGATVRVWGVVRVRVGRIVGWG